MQDLRLIGVDEDGKHLLLADPDGTHYRLALDESLRAAARRDRPRLGQLQIEMEGGMRPREVQSLIRAGATAEEVAERAGWTVEKVQRYEVPIVAERVHMAEQARQVRVRSRGGTTGSLAPTLQGRVAQRLRERGVDPDTNVWDSWRGIDETHWTVVLTFAAGGRQRQAAWTYDPVLRTVEAADDEARWLSADEPAPDGPIPTSAARVSSVYDVEAEGGVAASVRRAGQAGRSSAEEEPLDLMTAMRQRTTVGRRAGRRRSPSAEPVRRELALPLENQTPSPAVRSHPVAATPVAEPMEVEAEEAPTAGVLQDAEPPIEPAGAETPPLDEADDIERLAAGDDAVRTEAVEETAVEEQPTPRAAASSAPVEEAVPTKKTASRRQRPSVPSWDDIMFGAKRD
jgi:hypothetical protein